MTDTIAPLLGEATVQELRETVHGRVLTSEDDAYTEAARIWNGAFDGRRPALIVQCTGVADVIAALGFARSNDLPLAVRGGLHSIAGFSTAEGGVVIDLSPMRGVRIDREAMSASVDGGATWAHFDHETPAYGLARPADSCPRPASPDSPWWGHRLADAQARPDLRQPLSAPMLSPPMVASCTRAVRERGSPLGLARRRRQLRGRHSVRVSVHP